MAASDNSLLAKIDSASGAIVSGSKKFVWLQNQVRASFA